MTDSLIEGARAEDGSRTDPASPVIVLTYPHAGVELLTSVLSGSRSLTCTSGTGLLPLCHEALSVWQQAEGRAGPPSTLAIRSVRALANTMITMIQAQQGGSRWCETAFTSPVAARAFLQVFPDASFICLHRSLSGVLREAARVYPWGLIGSPFWPFSAAEPGNNVAAIAAYWTARTEALLDFEAEQSTSCLRVRYEDIASDPALGVSDILTSIGLDARGHEVLRQPERTASDEADTEFQPPALADWIPAQLSAKVRDLTTRLSYDPPP